MKKKIWFATGCVVLVAVAIYFLNRNSEPKDMAVVVIEASASANCPYEEGVEFSEFYLTAVLKPHDAPFFETYYESDLYKIVALSDSGEIQFEKFFDFVSAETVGACVGNDQKVFSHALLKMNYKPRISKIQLYKQNILLKETEVRNK